MTGSCFRMDCSGGPILFDCGLFQRSKTEKELNHRPFPFNPSRIAAVVLSHTHIDHSGLLPKLVKDGFTGAIHATPATIDLAKVMLHDIAHIQEFEVEQLNRRRARHGEGGVQLIYTGAEPGASPSQGPAVRAMVRDCFRRPGAVLECGSSSRVGFRRG